MTKQSFDPAVQAAKLLEFLPRTLAIRYTIDNNPANTEAFGVDILCVGKGADNRSHFLRVQTEGSITRSSISCEKLRVTFLPHQIKQSLLLNVQDVCEYWRDASRYGRKAFTRFLSAKPFVALAVSSEATCDLARAKVAFYNAELLHRFLQHQANLDLCAAVDQRFGLEATMFELLAQRFGAFAAQQQLAIKG